MNKTLISGLLLAAALAVPFVVRAEMSVADAVAMARKKTLNFDSRGAVEIYDAILKEFPKEFPEIYLDRASALGMLEDWKGSIADYNKALSLDSGDPKKWRLYHPEIYEKRAESKHYSGDLKGAVADYGRAIELNPKSNFLYSHRAGIKVDLDDYAGALKDYSSAISIAEKPGQLDYQNRGIVRICLRDFPNALIDLQEAVKLARAETYSTPSVRDQNLLIWHMLVRLGKKAEADGELAALLASLKPDGDGRLNREIARYYLGQTEASVVLATAEEYDKKSEEGPIESWRSVAYYFVGMKQLLDGHKTEALEYFRKSLKCRDAMSHMRELALAEAKALAPKKR
ncbi:MAG: hypothetical protein ABL955_06195 [Elusimicrobiota bacterium]